MIILLGIGLTLGLDESTVDRNHINASEPLLSTITSTVDWSPIIG